MGSMTKPAMKFGMPFEEAFETAYSNLVSAGLDADEVLAEFMEPSTEP